MKTTGYSGKSLSQKLGIKTNYKVKILNPPAEFYSYLDDLPENVELENDDQPRTTNLDMIIYFVQEHSELITVLPILREQILKNGMIWVCWYKKNSKIPTDITEDIIRNEALKISLVDVKVCAIDELRSGLKLVIPVNKR